MTDYELPNISVDVVPVFANPQTNRLQVLASRRLYEPFQGEYALPGVLLSPHERIEEAVYRALQDKAGISRDAVSGLYDLGTFDNPDRDPRGATVSIARVAVLNANFVNNSETNTLVDVEAVISKEFSLPFDHATIITAAVTMFTEKFLASKAFTFDILGEEFTTKTIRGVMQQIAKLDVSEDHLYDSSNLTRQLKATGWVSAVNDEVNQNYTTSDTMSSTGSLRGRPSRTWRWM